VPSVAVVLNHLNLDRADHSLREDLREFVTFGRGFAHGKPIPLTTTRHADYPVSAPGSYQAHEEPSGSGIPPYEPQASYEPPTHMHEPSRDNVEPSHESSDENIEEDRSEGRNDEDSEV